MFTVNHRTNRISPVKIKSFTERKHLQEWLAHQPDALDAWVARAAEKIVGM